MHLATQQQLAAQQKMIIKMAPGVSSGAGLMSQQQP